MSEMDRIREHLEEKSPAHPVVISTHEFCAWHSGMTLRDWFAGQALAGLLAGARNGFPEYRAADAYLLADAMMEARK